MSISAIIDDFLQLVRYCRYDNSYKMVWAKAIIDLANENPERTVIPVENIADKVIGYYWNLHIFFDPDGQTLLQSSNRTKPPVVQSYVLSLISNYKDLCTEYKPCFYERLTNIHKEQLAISYTRVANDLKRDVRERFLYLNNDYKTLYDYKTDDNNIIFDTGACRQLSEHHDILNESILFKWTQILEKFNNTTPRIAAKLKLRHDGKQYRGSLKKFHKWLSIENPNRKCAICDEHIKDENDLAVDHVIPFTFLFSDDIWNLSFVHQSCNSRKSNTPPSKKAIKAQEQRNLHLQQLITRNHSHDMSKKIFKELSIAIEDKVLDKMWAIYKL